MIAISAICNPNVVFRNENVSNVLIPFYFLIGKKMIEEKYTEFFSKNKNKIKITKNKELALREYWVNPPLWSNEWYYQSLMKTRIYNYEPEPLTELTALEIHDILKSLSFKKYYFKKRLKDFFRKLRRDPNNAGI